MRKRKLSHADCRAEKTPTRPTPAAALAEVHLAMEQRAARQARRQPIQAVVRWRRLGRLGAVALVALGLLVVAGLLMAAAWRAAHQPRQAVEQPPGAPVPRIDTPHPPYTTDPPTSGPQVNHVPSRARAATLGPQEVPVHALAEGGVLIHYQRRLDTAIVEKLAAFTARDESPVILNPAWDLGQMLVVTAWGRMQRFTTNDEPRLQRFIAAFPGLDPHPNSGSYPVNDPGTTCAAGPSRSPD